MRPIKGLWAVWPAMKTEGHGRRLSQIFPLPPSNDAHILSSLHASIRFRTFKVKRQGVQPVELPDKTQDTQLNLNFRQTRDNCYCMRHTYTKKKKKDYSLFIWNSDFTGCPDFCLIVLLNLVFLVTGQHAK